MPRVWAPGGREFSPISPGERGPLFAALVKLLQFALRASSASTLAKGCTDEEEALLLTIRPLVTKLTVTSWRCLQHWPSPSQKDEQIVPSVESLGPGKPGSRCHDC